MLFKSFQIQGKASLFSTDALIFFGMSTLKLMGIILIVAGAIALGYQTISYNKQHELFRIGDASATVTTTETKQIPMWLGFALVGGGVVLVISGNKRTA